MDYYFLKTYQSICKSEFGEYGFKNYRDNHYRVVNDVFQSFRLHRSITDLDCTVEFLIEPLCSERVIDKTTCGADHLKMFEGIYSWFPYNKNSEESMKACILEMVGYMHKYLMPFFERGNSCKNAYDVLEEFEIVSRTKIDKQDELFGFLPYSHTKAFITLKIGDYSKACEHFEAVVAQWVSAYEHNMKISEGNMPPEYTQRHEMKLIALREKIRRIAEHDMDFILNSIQDNEMRSLENLRLT